MRLRPILLLLLPLLAAAAPPACACTGDCNRDGEVTIDEVIAGVNIALGTAALAGCPSFDRNEDGEVTVDEVVTSLNAALAGCPAATPTPTSTASPTPTLVPNHAPVFGPLPAYRAYAGFPIAWPIPVTDADGDSVICDAIDPLPEGAVLGGSQGVLEWTPTAEQVGAWTVRIVCSDRWAPAVGATLGIVVQAADACGPPVCDPAAGCSRPLPALDTPCCAAGPGPSVPEPDLPCPDGLSIELLDDTDTWVRMLGDCDTKRVMNFAQSDAQVRFRLLARCINLDDRSRVRARMETATRLLFDREYLVPFPTPTPGGPVDDLPATGTAEYLRSPVIPFAVDPPRPFYDIEGSEANLTVTLRDPQNRIVTRSMRLRLTFTPIPTPAPDTTPTP